MTGKCPKCENIVSYVKYEGVDAKPPFGTGSVWKTINMLCPSCSTILGSAIDPIAIRTDIIKSLKST